MRFVDSEDFHEFTYWLLFVCLFVIVIGRCHLPMQREYKTAELEVDGPKVTRAVGTPSSLNVACKYPRSPLASSSPNTSLHSTDARQVKVVRQP